MTALSVTFKKGENDDEFQIYLHPESLVTLVFDMQQDGMSESEIASEIEKMKETILDDFKARMASGEIESADSDEDVGCGDPSCPNCGVGIVYH